MGAKTLILLEAVVISIAVLGDLFASMRNSLCVWGLGYQLQQPSDRGTETRRLREWEALMGYGMA